MATGQLIVKLGEPSEPASEEHVDQSDSPGGFGVLQDNGGVTYEYMGKFGGGAEITRWDHGEEFSTSETPSFVLTEITVPPDRTATFVLAWVTSSTVGSLQSNWPRFSIGDTGLFSAATSGTFGNRAMVREELGPGTHEIAYHRNSTSASYNTTISNLRGFWWVE